MATGLVREELPVECIVVDDETCIVALEVPGAEVVLLQAYFELYEGPGTVRTINVRESLICIITTPSMVFDCIEVLEAIRHRVHWRFARTVTPEQMQRVFDFQPKRKR